MRRKRGPSGRKGNGFKKLQKCSAEIRPQALESHLKFLDAICGCKGLLETKERSKGHDHLDLL